MQSFIAVQQQKKLPLPAPGRLRHSRRAIGLHRQEICQQPVPLLAENALRMKLYTFKGQGTMTDAHDFIVSALPQTPGGNLQAGRQTGGLHHQRMIAGHGQIRRQTGENPPSVMDDRGGLTVHNLLCPHNAGAEYLRYGLVPEANP